MHYLVDGYNLMFALAGDDEDFAARALEQRRQAVIELLARFSQASGKRLVVVFDGGSPSDWTDRETRSGPITVIFSHHTSEADTVIIRRIAASTAGRHLAVVSDDRKIRDAVRRGKATSVRCDAFLAQVAKALSRRGSGEPREKFRGLSDDEVRAWMSIMGFGERSKDADDEGRGGSPT